MSTVLVTGASGNIGSALVDELVARGVPVRVAVHGRPFQRSGVQPVPFDFDDPATIERGVGGVDRLFLLTPFDPLGVERANRTIDAARRAGVRHIVRLSAIHADREPDTARRWHRATERHLEASGIAATVLRPNSFMQNLSGYLAPLIRKTGMLPLPLDDAKLAMVDTRDVGAVAAVVLTEPGHEGRAYTLTGPRAIGYAEAAEILSAAAGRTIRYAPVTPEQSAEGARQAGYPDWLVDVLGEMDAWVRTGSQAEVTGDVQQVLRRPPRSFEEFAREHAAVWR